MINEYLKKRRIRKMMSEYLTPEVVAKILADQTASKITIELTREEALILFKGLARLSKAGSLPSDDHPEKRVFLAVQVQLEGALGKSLGSDDGGLLARAKGR